MGKYIDFEGSNFTFFGNGRDVGNLRVLFLPDQFGKPVIISAWQLTPMELTIFQEEREFFIYQTQSYCKIDEVQPCLVSSVNPFQHVIYNKPPKHPPFIHVPPGIRQFVEQVESHYEGTQTPCVITAFAFSAEDIQNLIANGGIVFSYIWADRPFPQSVSNLNPLRRYPPDPDLMY